MSAAPRVRSFAYKLRGAAISAARQSALSALARAHPDEFAALYQAELDKAGIKLSPAGRPRKRSGVIPESPEVRAGIGEMIAALAVAFTMPPDDETAEPKAVGEAAA